MHPEVLPASVTPRLAARRVASWACCYTGIAAVMVTLLAPAANVGAQGVTTPSSAAAPATPSPEPAVTRVDYATAHLERKLPATRTSSPISIDGILDEPAWHDAPVATHFLQSEPREGVPATFDTEVRVVHDDDALYFGVFARDDDPSAIIVSDLKKDFNANASDSFSIVIDTFGDQRNGFEFATNPAGARWDAQMANEGREVNSNWDGIWDVRTRVGRDGWYAEIRIPFKTLKFTSRDPQAWGVNFLRRLRRRNEEDFWSPVPRQFNLERVSLAGSIDGFHQLRPGANLRIKPFAATSSSTIGRQPSHGDVDGGLDVKYGITNGLTLDATVNTDFSQVEADEQQVNLTRFNVLFPEKRDFFLENSGIFQFGLPSSGSSNQGGGGGSPAANGRQNSPPDVRMFFSRQVGLSEGGAAIPILAGSRLTGKTGDFSLGVLNIQQRSQGPVAATNFTAVRVQRAILANSDVGVLLLNKDARGNAYNRVAGVDANFRFGQLSVGAYGVKTMSPEARVAGKGDDSSLRANFNYQSRSWLIRGAYETIGERFNNELGFVPRTGVNHRASYLRYNVRPRWAQARGVREIGPHLHFDQFDRRDGTGTESRYFDWHLVLMMNDSGFFETGINRNLEDTQVPFTLNSSRGVRVAPGDYRFNEYFVLYRSNNSKRLAVEGRYSTGGLYNGTRNGYAVGPTVRWNEHFNASLSLQVNDIELPTAAYVSTLIASRVNYSFNTRLFVNALVQYNTDTHQWSTNARFNVIHRPLSDFFFVYNERRLDTGGDLVDRSVIAKLTWLMAF